MQETLTMDVTPDWPGMRRWVLYVARTDLPEALRIAARMNQEAPTIQELIDAWDDAHPRETREDA